MRKSVDSLELLQPSEIKTGLVTSYSSRLSSLISSMLCACTWTSTTRESSSEVFDLNKNLSARQQGVTEWKPVYLHQLFFHSNF